MKVASAAVIQMNGLIYSTAVANSWPLNMKTDQSDLNIPESGL